MVTHYHTMPCNTNSPYLLHITEEKSKVTCRRCITIEKLPPLAIKRRERIKEKKEIEKKKQSLPIGGDHFKYRRHV